MPPKGASDTARAKELIPAIPAFSSARVRRALVGEQVNA